MVEVARVYLRMMLVLPGEYQVKGMSGGVPLGGDFRVG
jgi:hypothetical protein